MKPAPFDYHLAHSLDEALALLEQHAPDVKSSMEDARKRPKNRSG